MKTKTVILIAICIALSYSCNKTKDKLMLQESVAYEMSYISDKSMAPPPPPPPPASSRTNKYNPKLIKKGNMTISSSDVESTKKIIYEILTQCNGYVESETLKKAKSQPSTTSA